MEESRIIEALRSIELYGYHIAYYLLQDEQLSARAAANALKELHRDRRFARASLEERKLLAKRAVMKQAIKLKRREKQIVRC